MLNSLSVQSGLRMNFGDCGLSFFSPVSKSRTGLFFFSVRSGPVQSLQSGPASLVLTHHLEEEFFPTTYPMSV